MDQAAVLQTFQAGVEDFKKFQGFIDKAREHAGRFNPKVVEKVVADNTERQVALAADLIPLASDLQGRADALRAEAVGIRNSASGSQEKLEELELRHVVGEIDGDAFALASGDLKGDVDGAEGRAAEKEAEAQSLADAVGAWQALGESSGVLAAGASAPAAAAAPAADDHSADAAESVAHEASATLAPAEAAKSPRAAFAVGDLDILGEDSEAGQSEEPAVESNGTDRVRKAVLLYQEGTADEQVYPFNNDALSLGRGRDNDIQVKNDSKVSRYHCKLYRKTGNFYVEDNKSANGTLVNGELITERRLFGGEEVIIGETFFRFRILD